MQQRRNLPELERNRAGDTGAHTGCPNSQTPCHMPGVGGVSPSQSMFLLTAC